MIVGRGSGQVYNKYSPGAELERKIEAKDRFSSIGEICMAIKEEARPTANPQRRDLLRKLENVRSFQNSFGSEDPGAGGFLIPEIMRSELLELALEESIVRPRATVIPMSTLRVPIPTVDDTSHVSNLFGGVTYYWAEESSSLPESTASFGRVVLDAKKLVGFFKVPNELLADAPAFSSWFDTRIPAGLAWTEDVAFMQETGTGTPQGFINGPAYIQIDRAATGAIAWSDIVTMYSRMLPQSLNSAAVGCAGARHVPADRAAVPDEPGASGSAAGPHGTPPRRRRCPSWAARCSSRRRVPSARAPPAGGNLRQ